MLFSIEIMNINLLTLLFMVIMGVLVNFAMLKLLTEKISPPGFFAGVQGNIGKKGSTGPIGEMGERGPKAEKQDRGDRGEKGLKGKDSECQLQDEYVDESTGVIKGGCSSENNDWNMMGLTSYNARNKIGCLFGYKLEGGVCVSPINGSTSQENNLRKYGIKDWQPANRSSNFNCNYKKNVISELEAPQFREWAKLMSARNCPGVPLNGTVPGAEKGVIDDYTDDKYKICSTIFKNCSGCNEEQHAEVCKNSNMNVATAGQVEHAYNRCELDIGKHGRIADGRFAYPVKVDSGIYKAGPNINAYDGNDGVFCVKKDAPDAEQNSESLVAPTPAPTPPPTEKPKPLPKINNWKKIPGGLKQVSASGNGWVWGVNSAGSIYKCKKPCTGSWSLVDGGLVQVSAGDKEVWGVNSAGSIYKRPVDGSGNWQKIPGGLKHVSASGNGWIWGVNSANKIYKCKKPCNGNWQHITDGRLKMISGGKTNVYGIGLDNGVYTRPIDGSGSWNKIPKEVLKEVSASNDGYIWGVNSGKNVYRCKEPCKGNWEYDSTQKLNQISAGNSYVWGINGSTIYKKSNSAEIPKSTKAPEKIYTFYLKYKDKGWGGNSTWTKLLAKGETGETGWINMLYDGDRNESASVPWKGNIGKLKSLHMYIPDKGRSPSIALEEASVSDGTTIIKTQCPGASGCDGDWWGPGEMKIA